MAITVRARKRLLLLAVLGVVLGVFGTGAWFVRQVLRDRNADISREEGIALWEAGEYEEALPKLSIAATRDGKDSELLVIFADARSRVPAPGGKHLLSAMRFYTVAIDNDPNNLDAYLGLMRIQLEGSMISQLTDTAKKVRQLAPDNEDALRILKTIAERRGRFAPNIGTQGTEDDDSALRWVDELIALKPDSMRYRLDRLALMQQAGSSPEEIIALAEQWADEADPGDGSFDVILAQACASQEIDGEAERLVMRALEKKIPSSTAMLMAIDLLFRFGRVEEAGELTSQATIQAMENQELAQAMVRKPWREGRPDLAVERLNEFQEQLKDDPINVLLAALLLSIQGERDQSMEWAKMLEQLGKSPDRSTAETSMITKWITFLELINLESAAEDDDGVTFVDRLDEIERVITDIPDREFVGILVGDLYRELGMESPAARHYASATDSSGALHVIAGQRLIRTLLSDRRPIQALPVAELLVRRYPRVLATYIELIRVRAAMERSGLNAAEEGAMIRPTESSYQIMRRIWEAQGKPRTGQSLLVETALAGGQSDEAVRIIEDVIEQDEPLAEDLMRIAQIGIQNDLFAERFDLAFSLLEQVESNTDDQVTLDAVTASKSQLLRADDRHEEAWEIVNERYGNRTDPAGIRLLALEALDHAVAMNPDEVTQRILALLELDIDYRLLARLMNLAIFRADEPLARMVQERITELMGPDSTASLFAEADLVLAFPESPNRGLSQIIGDLELHADRDPNSIDIVFRQYQLLDRLDPNDLNASTELLQQAVNVHPDLLEFYPPLIDHLQRSGRFREAEDYVQRFERYRTNASPALRRAMAQLTAGQGDVDSALEAFRDVSDSEDALIEDRLRYLDLLFSAGKMRDADALLASLMSEENRPVEVDRRAAFRTAQLGNMDQALEILDSTPGFPSETERTLARASLLSSYGFLEQAIDELSADTSDDMRNSVEGNIIRAGALSNLGRFEEARGVFDRAAELAADNESVLLMIANMQLARPELRSGVRPVLEQVLSFSRRPARAEVMLLSLEAAGEGDDFEPDQADLARATELTRKYPGLPEAWNLALQLHLAAGDFDNYENMAKAASTRFGANANFPRQYAQYLNYRNRHDEAVAFANEASERTPGERLIDAVPLAIALEGLGQYVSVAATLNPFRDRIASDLQAVPPKPIAVAAYETLVGSLMRTNQVDDAWRYLKASGQFGWQLSHWQRMLGQLEGRSARKAIDHLESALGDTPQDKIAIAMSWIGIARRSQDDDVRELAAERVNRLRDPSIREELGYVLTPSESIQVELLNAGLQEQISELDALESYKATLDMFPAAIRDLNIGPNGLTARQREQFGPLIGPYLMALNNYAAIASKLGRELEEARKAAQLALRINSNVPELLDTLAMVELAAGNGPAAVEYARRAVELAPARLTLQYTLAQAMVEVGELEAAMDILNRIEDQNGSQPEPDPELAEDVIEIKTQLQRRIAG